MEDNIIDGDIIWATEGYLDYIFDGTEEGHATLFTFITWQYLFDKGGISAGIDEEDMIGSTLWLGITEPDSEIIK